MSNITKTFKVDFEAGTLSITIDDSYIASNLYKNEIYIPEINGTHYHALYEVFIVLQESITLFSDSISGEYKDCVLCIPPLCNHYTLRKSDYRLLVSYTAKNGAKADDFSVFLNELFCQKKPVVMKSGSNISLYATELKRYFFENQELFDQTAPALLRLIICELFQLNKMKKTVEAKGEKSYLVEIENIIFDFHNDINLTFIAKVLNLSTKQVSRIIKKHYNTTLSDMLTKRRLNVACALLKSSNMSIKDIVEYINFPSESYFYARFKNEYGCTPLCYRKQCKK